jgi:Nuclease-related domain/UvrD-like helicase C-terminal domain/AAA domain
MARMIPSTVRDFHGSQGEERVFHALRGLPDEVTVIHSFRWLHPGAGRGVTAKVGAQGEGDFVLFDPAKGVLVVEVKGGDIWCERGEWRQRNRRTGEVRAIAPEEQARATVHRIREEIQAKFRGTSSLLFCHAVWFPDAVADRAKLPMYCPSEIVLDAEDILRPHVAIRKVFEYWHKALPGRGGVSTEDGQRVLDALAPTFSLVRTLRQTLDEREEQFIQLTDEQARVIHYLDEQRHATIHGAAGTGKTLVAVEKAKRLASPSEPFLFLCYNSALKNFLQANHTHPNVHYATFHGFARELVGPEGPLENAEQALLTLLIDDAPIPYSHLIVDEGQDFKADWLEYLNHRFRHGTFYVFYDRHQLVQADDARWLDAVPCRLVLSRNCRNTDPIARLAYRAAGLSISPTLGVTGPKPILHVATDEARAVEMAKSLLEAALAGGRIPGHELVVLSLDTLPEGSLWRRLRVGAKELADDPAPNRVTLTTARRFKGLEASLVIVVDVDFRKAGEADWRRRLYVACSRGRHAVHMITTNDETDLGPAIWAFSDTDKARPTWRGLARHLGVRLSDGETHDPFQEPRAG